MTTTSARSGEWVDTAATLADIDFDKLNTRIPTDRYTSGEFLGRERDLIWNRLWQIVGRVDDLPEVGDWKEYQLFDESYIVVRGRDGVFRGFVNACRHRGNLLCQGSGNSKRFLCPYHLWSYDLDGKLRGVLQEEVQGPVDKDELSLLSVPVECFAGFVFLNPDPDAAPLADFIGQEVMDLLAPYHLDEMTTVMNVRESLECNWKVVMDAFMEGYHIPGIHPELLRSINIDATKSRYRFFKDHSVAAAPFDVAVIAPADGTDRDDPELQVKGITELPETFPTVTAVLPRFGELVDGYRDERGRLRFPADVSARTLLQQATRETLAEMGLEVTGLTDAQMSDNQGWFLFPNFFMTIRAGEAHVIMSTPSPDADPNRCFWHVSSYMWLPPEHRAAFRASLIDVKEPGEFDYFRALQQDYEQMPRQQLGLRNGRLEHIALVKGEVVIAHYHSVLDRYLSTSSAP